MSGEQEEMTNKDLVSKLKEELNAGSNEEVLSLLAPHLPGIRKPTPEEGYPVAQTESD